jgi:hypothetical protein
MSVGIGRRYWTFTLTIRAASQEGLCSLRTWRCCAKLMPCGHRKWSLVVNSSSLASSHWIWVSGSHLILPRNNKYTFHYIERHCHTMPIIQLRFQYSLVRISAEVACLLFFSPYRFLPFRPLSHLRSYSYCHFSLARSSQGRWHSVFKLTRKRTTYSKYST